MRHLALVLVSLLGAACGARTPLSIEELGASGGGGGSAGSSGSAGTGAGGSGGSATGGSGGAPEPPCVLAPVGEPVELLAFPEGNTDTPLMVVLDAGSGASPPRLAYAAISEDANFWHPELRVGELTIGAIWPDGVKFSHSPVLYGFDAHAWGLLAPDATGDSNRLSLGFFHADEASPNVKPALKFRGFDAAAWQPLEEVPVDPTGTVVYSFAAGESVQAGAYAGAGYAMAYRGSLDDGSAEPRLVVLDDAGKLRVGPLGLAPPEKYPGRVSDLAWTGQTYLLTTPSGPCPPTADCAAPSLAVRALVPKAAAPKADFVLTASIETLDPNALPRRAAISSLGGTTFVAWSEALAAPDDAPRTVRLAKLSPDGKLLGTPAILDTNAHPVHAISVAVTSIGVLVWWGETVDPSSPESAIGHGRLVIHHFDLEGSALEPVTTLPTTAFAYGPPPSAVSVSNPRAALISWGAQSETSGKNVTWLARLDCAVPGD